MEYEGKIKLLYLFLLLPFVTIPAFAMIGFQPVYQPSGASGSNPTELYCVFGDFLNSYNATTNVFTCGTAPAGSGGENNTASNVGFGEDIFKQKTGVDLEFRGIAVSGDLSISSNTTDITISYDDPAGNSGNATILNDLGDVIITSPAYLSTLFYDGINWIDKIFTINNQSVTAGTFITGINNQTGVITTQTFKGDTTTCSGSDKFSAYDNQTGDYTCASGSGGFTNIASAPQTTATLISDNSTVSNSATLKTLTQGTGITLTNGSNAVTIATTAGAFKNPLLDGSNHTDTTSSSPPNRGDLITGSSSNLWDDLPIGTTGKVLTSNGTDASWQTPSGGTAREDTVAYWVDDKTWANIGTTLINPYLTGQGDEIRIDTNGKTTATLLIDWTKVGAGTQKCEIRSSTSPSIVLIVIASLGSGINTNSTQDIPTNAENRIDRFEPVCASSTSTDDPVWLSGQVLLR